jgi:hypothetical protein
MDYEKIKMIDLKKIAEDLSKKFQIPFKKSVNGKNKTELIKFIKNIETPNNDSLPLPPPNEYISKSKKELVEIAKILPNFKKSFENKSKSFLIEFIEKNKKETSGTISPIHFEDFINSPDPQKIQEAIIKCFSDKPFNDKI